MTRIFLLVLLFVIVIPCFAAGDIVFFKDDRRPVEGKVTVNGDKIIVETADGKKHEFAAGDVDKIVEGKTLLDIYFEKLGDLKVENLDELFDLAMWCDKVGLQDKKSVLLLEILTKEPDYAKVHEYLGHVFRNGKWVNPDMGEEFGDDIENTLIPGNFVDIKGKFFIVRTDTSKEFGEFVSNYLDRFSELIRDHFKGELAFREPKFKPVMIILADYKEYSETFRLFADKVLPRKRDGILIPKTVDYVPPEYTCFLDPSEFALVTYKYKKQPKVSGMRENVQKLTGYGLYISAIGGYTSIYKSPRFFVEGFSEYVSRFTIQNNRIEPFIPSDTSAWRMVEQADATVSGLFNVDPLSYYRETMAKHVALSYSLTHFMLHGAKAEYRPDYFKLSKLDTSNALKIDSFKKTIGKYEKFEKEWAEFLKRM